MSETSQTKIQKNESDARIKGNKRDREASEERLMNAGLETFSKYGFNGTTTRMIAKKADVNESLIGRYFDGKEGLLIAITQRFIEESVQSELSYPPQDNLADELEKYILHRMNDACTHEDFGRMIFSQCLVDKKFKKRAQESIPMTVDPKLIERVQRLADLKKIKPGMSVMDMCHDIDTYLDGIFFFEVILREEPKEVLIPRIIRFVRTYSQVFSA